MLDISPNDYLNGFFDDDEEPQKSILQQKGHHLDDKNVIEISHQDGTSDEANEDLVVMERSD